MAQARTWAIATFDTPEEQIHWDQWRGRARAESDERGPSAGPVIRREPSSAVPPALALMQDHFISCLVFSLVMTSALFVTFMVAIRGAFGSSQLPRASTDR